MKLSVKLAVFCLLATSPVFSQSDTVLSDLDIAVKLLTQSSDQIVPILNNLGVEYYITNQGDETLHFYILRGNSSVRGFTLTINDIYAGSGSNAKLVASDICTEVLVRYVHDNLNDLRDFYSYDLPADRQYWSFEKSLGVYKSHLKLTYTRYE